MKADTRYRGHYHQFFHTTATALLDALRGWGGTAVELAALGPRLAQALPLSIPGAASGLSFVPGTQVGGWWC